MIQKTLDHDKDKNMGIGEMHTYINFYAFISIIQGKIYV